MDANLLTMDAKELTACQAAFEADYQSNMIVRDDNGFYRVPMVQLSWQTHINGWRAHSRYMARQVLEMSAAVDSKGNSYSMGCNVETAAKVSSDATRPKQWYPIKKDK